jgi:hypothetical protein
MPDDLVKVAQEQAAKIAKTHDRSTSIKSPAPKPSTITPPPLSSSAKKDTYGASASNQQPTDQSADLKEAAHNKVPADLNDSEKKFRVNTCLDPK